jgi:hypothetical protein
VRLSLHSNQEARIPEPVTDRPVEVDATPPVPVESAKIPFDRELRAMLSAQGIAGAALEDRIRELSWTTVGDVSTVQREAWNIQQIAADDFSARDLAHLRTREQVLWLALLSKHTQLLDQRLLRLDDDLNPFRSRAPFESNGQPKVASFPANTAELAEASRQLNTDSQRLDQLLTAGLTLSPYRPPQAPSFLEAEVLLAKIRARERILNATVERLSAAAHAGQD